VLSYGSLAAFSFGSWLVQQDVKLVTIMYRTHKALHPSCKVSSLYAFDALARAAKSHAKKHDQTVSTDVSKGNCASFLQKLAGVLDGLFKDMMVVENEEAKVRRPFETIPTDLPWRPDRLTYPATDQCRSIVVVPVEQSSAVFEHFARTNFVFGVVLLRTSMLRILTCNQEKTKKILDIWTKGHTFPPAVLSRLSRIVEGSDKGAYQYFVMLPAKYTSASREASVSRELNFDENKKTKVIILCPCQSSLWTRLRRPFLHHPNRSRLSNRRHHHLLRSMYKLRSWLCSRRQRRQWEGHQREQCSMSSLQFWMGADYEVIAKQTQT
jgi:hypothetical protein